MSDGGFADGFLSALAFHATPQPLTEYAQLMRHRGIEIDDLSAAVVTHLADESSFGGALHTGLQMRLIEWDSAPRTETWTRGTPPATVERRQLVFRILEATPALCDQIDRYAPVYVVHGTTAIDDGFHPWYAGAAKQARFYWDRYLSYLTETSRWPAVDLALLDVASDRVVERLADPHDPTVRATRGLVVGYVQAGKTANLTAVVAKAADAGYRLFILLSGTTNLLRTQTQRRIDKELIGREMITPIEEYLHDDDWDRFQSYGARPSELGAFDWTRLTGRHFDYHSLEAGVVALDVGLHNPGRPAYHPENTRHIKAVMLVVKKNKAVLTRLRRTLGQVGRNLADLPAFVIDDESDLASVNTGRDRRERTAVNREIVSILARLPRAQYVGYTATPFANVFIDPDDPQDLFPRHFVISLEKPSRYMGASDFHDLDGVLEDLEGDVARSNKAAYVRDVIGEDELADNLAKAIDSYVLSGAIKLYRNAQEPGRFNLTHHTMLVHTSSRMQDHERDKERVLATLACAGYEAGHGLARIESLLEVDFRPVWEARAPDIPFPETFSALRAHFGEALRRIMEGSSPVLVVNSSEDGEAPDFQQGEVWKILVGGSKLSRGYTIEGLTTSYFRRRAAAADTLMQMGRWFGYRIGYMDLVRLFIGRRETAAGVIHDLYEAFEGLCRTEEDFRSELRRYDLGEDGLPKLRPVELPPIVTSYVPWLQPVAPAKMWNVRIVAENFGGNWHDPTLAPEDERDRRHNSAVFESLLGGLEWRDTWLSDGSRRVHVFCAPADHLSVISALEEYRWRDRKRPQRHELALEYMKRERQGPESDHGIASWLIVAPQLKSYFYDENWQAGGRTFSVKQRARDNTTHRVRVFTEPDHKRLAEYLTGKATLDRPDLALQELKDPSRAVMLFYPTRHTDIRGDAGVPTMGFAILYPANRIPQRRQFQVRQPNVAAAAVDPD